MKTFKEYLSKAAGKIMGVAPETPQYKVGQHVNYEMSPPKKAVQVPVKLIHILMVII